MPHDADPRAHLPTTYLDLRTALDERSELGWLRRSEGLGVPIAPMAVVPARVEHDFYRWNHLPTRLETLFAGVDARDPDEDDLEELAPEAIAWVRGHALLDEVVDAFYAALVELPSRVVVRRPGAAGREAVRGRPALLAVKRTWADDWSPAALARRAAAGEGWCPSARAVLVHGADLHEDVALAGAAGAAIGRRLRAWCDPEGRLARLKVDDARSPDLGARD